MEAGSLMILINGEPFEHHTKRHLRIKMQSLQLDKEISTLIKLEIRGTLVNLPYFQKFLVSGQIDKLLVQDVA